MGAATRLKTFPELYAEVEALPPGMTGEILGPGWLRTMSRPGKAHRAGNKRLSGALHAISREAGGPWWLEQEAEILIDGGKLYVPDLSAWRLLPDEDLAFLDDNPIERPPDWVCELLSRNTQRGDRVVKLPEYARSGVRWAWVADPAALTIEAYEMGDRGPVLVATVRAADNASLPPFDLPICPDALFTVR